MTNDTGHWDDDLFIINGHKYGVTPSLKTVELLDNAETKPDQPNSRAESAVTGLSIPLPIPTTDVTDNSLNYCIVCGRPVPGKRRDRRYCSSRCRQRARRRVIAGVLIAGNIVFGN
jgi:predicted nucleic acid-binding Zn ribbon protein